MKVVLDTNVIVSALINPYGAPAAILGLILEEKIELCYDMRILVEYRDVLMRPKFGFVQTEIDGLLEYIKEIGSLYIATNTSIRLKDPDDSPFLEVAVVSGADFLITGNIKHFPRKTKTQSVVTPKEFLGIIT